MSQVHVGVTASPLFTLLHTLLGDSKNVCRFSLVCISEELLSRTRSPLLHKLNEYNTVFKLVRLQLDWFNWAQLSQKNLHKNSLIHGIQVKYIFKNPLEWWISLWIRALLILETHPNKWQIISIHHQKENKKNNKKIKTLNQIKHNILKPTLHL